MYMYTHAHTHAHTHTWSQAGALLVKAVLHLIFFTNFFGITFSRCMESSWSPFNAAAAALADVALSKFTNANPWHTLATH